MGNCIFQNSKYGEKKITVCLWYANFFVNSPHIHTVSLLCIINDMILKIPTQWTSSTFRSVCGIVLISLYYVMMLMLTQLKSLGSQLESRTQTPHDSSLPSPHTPPTQLWFGSISFSFHLRLTLLTLWKQRSKIFHSSLMLLFGFTAFREIQESIKAQISAGEVKAFDPFWSFNTTLNDLVAINGSIKL